MDVLCVQLERNLTIEYKITELSLDGSSSLSNLQMGTFVAPSASIGYRPIQSDFYEIKRISIPGST